MINITFGTGGTYPYWGSATHYYDHIGAMWHIPGVLNGVDSGTLSDDYTLTMISAVTEPIPLDNSYWYFTPRLNGHTLTITSNLYHNGNPLGGYLWDWTASAFNRMVLAASTNGNGTLIFKGLNIRVNAAAIAVYFNENIPGRTLIFDDCIINGGTYTFSSNSVAAGTSTVLNIQRCKFSGASVNNFSAGSYQPFDTMVFENNDFMNGVSNNFGGIWRNNFATGFQGSTGTNAGLNNATGYRNKSVATMSDAGWGAGTNNAGGKVAANEFVSTDITNPHFLQLAPLCTFYTGGIAPTLFSTDIAGYAIPDLIGDYPIGPHILLFPPTPNFTSHVQSSNPGAPIVFVNTSTPDVSTWLWDFGDGETSTLPNPVHQYNTNGPFTVTLTTSNIYASASVSKTYEYKGALVYRSAQAMLAMSKDGGETWGAERWEDIGMQGKFLTRMHWHRLGASRNAVFRLKISDPIKRVLIASHVTLEVENG
jgi:hypothetical protein